MTTKFTNIDERYGEQEIATIDDYRELNPFGIFDQNENGIYEEVNGEKYRVAEPLRPGRPTYYSQAMRQTAIWLPEHQITWLKSQGNMGEVIRNLIQAAIDAPFK